MNFREKYPLLFRNTDPQEPINLFGIECRKGWYDLLDCTFRTLYSRYKSTVHSLKYWENAKPNEFYTQEKIDQIVIEEKEKLNLIESELPVIDQCKEKFGTLRLYCSNINPYSQGIIDLAEEMSGHICEICGNSGKTSGTRWVSTLCTMCSEKKTLD